MLRVCDLIRVPSYTVIITFLLNVIHGDGEDSSIMMRATKRDLSNRPKQ